MKKLQLIAVSLLALVFGRPAGLCTANTLSEDVSAMNARLAKLEAENAELQKQLAAKYAAKPAAPAEPAAPGLLSMLAKGAGVDADDVAWRVEAGLDPEQAVRAALAQKNDAAIADKKKAEDAKRAKEFAKAS